MSVTQTLPTLLEGNALHEGYLGDFNVTGQIAGDGTGGDMSLLSVMPRNYVYQLRELEMQTAGVAIAEDGLFTIVNDQHSRGSDNDRTWTVRLETGPAGSPPGTRYQETLARGLEIWNRQDVNVGPADAGGSINVRLLVGGNAVGKTLKGSIRGYYRRYQA